MQPRIEPLDRGSRVDGVLGRLRELIFSGALPAGEQLPNERDLAGSLGVNRSSVREALRRLEFLELIEVRHGQGSFVRELRDSSALQLIEDLLGNPRTITVELLRQLLEFRRHVSVHVVELAARNHTQAQLERARALLERESEAGDDPAQALTLDVEMNALLGEATGNLMYQLISNLFTRLIERLGPLYYDESRDHGRSGETHTRLLEALSRRDAAGARAVLESMLDYSEDAILSAALRLEAEGRIGPSAQGPIT